MFYQEGQKITEIQCETLHYLSKYPFAMVTDAEFWRTYNDLPDKKRASRFLRSARSLQKRGLLDEAGKLTEEGHWALDDYFPPDRKSRKLVCLMSR